MKLEVVTFETERYQVKGRLDELRWSEEDDAWYLPGRVLSRDERTVYRSVFRVWPTAEMHHAARRALDDLDLEEIDMTELARIVKLRRLEKGGDETQEEFDARAAAYARACIAHCEELRALRRGEG